MDLPAWIMAFPDYMNVVLGQQVQVDMDDWLQKSLV